MTIWRLSFVCWVTKSTNTHSQYVILTDFSTATLVRGNCVNVTLYVFCLPSLRIDTSDLQHTPRLGGGGPNYDIVLTSLLSKRR